MKAYKYIVCMMAIGLFLSSCETMEKDLKQIHPTKILSRMDTIPEIFPEYQESDPIILGQRRQNPYEIQNMINAYDSLHAYIQNFIVGDIEPYFNAIYYRVLPRDSTDLAILSADSSVIYFDYPLDYDIVHWGSYYHDPSLGNSEYTWLYAVVPADHSLPDVLFLEILEKCYIPIEPIDTNHYDSIPDWRNGFAMLEYMAYRISGNIDMYDPNVVEIYDEILANTANRNIDNNSFQQLEGNSRSAFWDFITGVHPEGTFSVRNTYAGNEGIKNAKVYIHNFVKSYCGPLDANGHYYSTTRFRTHCWYHIRFENHHTLSKIYGGWTFLLGPVHRNVGWHKRSGHSCLLTHSDVAWRYATVNNAIETYYTYCNRYNILFPFNMRVWVTGMFGNDWAGSTPLFHKRHVPLQSAAFFGSLLLSPTISALISLIYFLEIPDMALFLTQGDLSEQTLSVYGTIFHEFSHASHYEKVGSNYWSHYVLHIIENRGYGNHADGLNHGYCGIGEMWGNFAESHLLYEYMGYDYPYIIIAEDNSLDTVAYTPPLPNYLWFKPFEKWYNPGILAKIHQDSHCTISNIYDALNPDVYSLNALNYSLQHQGINEQIILEAYHDYEEWNR